MSSTNSDAKGPSSSPSTSERTHTKLPSLTSLSGMSTEPRPPLKVETKGKGVEETEPIDQRGPLSSRRVFSAVDSALYNGLGVGGGSTPTGSNNHRPLVRQPHLRSSSIYSRLNRYSNDYDGTQGIGGEYVPDTLTGQYSPLFDQSTSGLSNAEVNDFMQETAGTTTPNGSDQYLPGLEFNINPATAMSPTLGLSESEWKAIPFSTRRKLKAAVQQQYSDLHTDQEEFISLPSSVSDTAQAKAIPFSKRRQRSTTMYPAIGRTSSVSTSAEDSIQSPAFQFLSRLGNANSDVTSGPGGFDDPGEQIGDYIVGKLIGYGGFSQVKEAHTMENGRKVVRAVKIVSKYNSASTPEHMEQIQNEFDHEVTIWKSLSHPNILRLIDVQDTPQATYCFSEKIDGGTLFDAVKNSRGSLDNAVVKRYVYELGSALLYLHETMHIVHRDIKLENCLLDMQSDGSLKVLLCDFGMSEFYGPAAEDAHMREERSAKNNAIIGPADTSSLFTQYHNHSHGDFSDQKSGNEALRRVQSLSNGPKRQISRELLSQHNRKHYQALENKVESGGSPHTPATTPTYIRDWSSPAHSFSTQNFGSLPYACPELLQSSVPIIDPSVDIWAFGIVIHALFLGHLPWNHAFLPKLRMMILNGDWNENGIVLKAGYEAADVIRMCLQVDKDQRADIRQIMASRLLQAEGRKYGPQGRRLVDDEELQQWSRDDND